MQVHHRKHKSKHSVLRREFHYIELGVVAHKAAAHVTGGDGSSSRYRFVSGKERGFVRMGLLSCFCASCFALDYSNCTTAHAGLKRVSCRADSGEHGSSEHVHTAQRCGSQRFHCGLRLEVAA